MAKLSIKVDLSFLMEIMDQRNALSLRGVNTRRLDHALMDEVRNVSKLLIRLRADDGKLLLEYNPSLRVLKALANCEVKTR